MPFTLGRRAVSAGYRVQVFNQIGSTNVEGRGAAVVAWGSSTIAGIFDTINDLGCMIIQTPAGRRMPMSAGDIYFGSAASRGMS